MIKKLIRVALSAIFCVAALVSCSTDRSQVLKVYNWGDYIDEDLLPEFEEWYEEQTGEKVRIIYQTFDINETMLSKIEKGHEDFDVVCPSEYIIERMLRGDMLLPLDFDFGDTPNYIDQFLAPYIKDRFDKVDGSGRNANDYAVGYMWGTTGILYNRKYVSDEDALTWDIVRNPKYADKIFIKDAPRDVYGPVSIYTHQDQIARGEVTLEELMLDSSEESVALVENFMAQVKPLIAGWEADFGKEQMTQERGWVNLTWSGDAVWAITEAKEVGVDLKYVVPLEGSNLWYDGWVIPKYARNVKAASYFINFMCRPDVAMRNMDVIGYVSAVASPEILEEMQDSVAFPETVDVRYFFGDIPGAEAAHLDPTQYFDQSVIDRCCMMHDWGDETYRLIEMWSRIKGDNANAVTLAVISVFFAALLVLGIRKRFFGRSKRRRRRRRRLARR